MDQAFVQHAQDDVDRDERGGDQQGFVGERLLVGFGSTGEGGVNGGGDVNLAARLFDRVYRLTQGNVRRQIEGDGDRREQTLVIHGERGGGGNVMRDGAERDFRATGGF